jgi:hypothetical protein
MEPENELPRPQEPALYPILTQINSFYTLTPYFSQILFNIILLSTLKSSRERIPVGYLTKILYHFPTHSCYKSAHLVLLFNIAVHIRQNIPVSLQYWLCEVIETNGLYNSHFVVAKSRVQISGRSVAPFTGFAWFSWLPPGKYRIVR